CEEREKDGDSGDQSEQSGHHLALKECKDRGNNKQKGDQGIVNLLREQIIDQPDGKYECRNYHRSSPCLVGRLPCALNAILRRLFPTNDRTILDCEAASGSKLSLYSGR